MKSTLIALTLALLFFALPGVSPAEPLKTCVSEFSITGTSGKDELKAALQGLLASRLNPERVQLVENKDQAELVISGSYALFGKMFSVDVLLRNMGSGKLTRLFEQGDNQDDLLPALGRLAQKIDQELAKNTATATTSAVPAVPAVPAAQAEPVTSPTPLPQTLAVPPPHKGVASASEGYLIRQESGRPKGSDSPLDGVFTGLALGRTLASGEREIFIAGERSLRYYRQGAGLKLVAEVTIPGPAKILGIDSADLDGDGVPEIYLTIMDRETLVSQVYLPGDTGLEKIAGDLPYFLRGIGPDLRSRKIFAQELGATGEVYDGVAQLVKTGSRFETGNPRKLPRYGSIFNFNRFSDGAGQSYDLVLNGEGRLIVSSPEGLELWKSSDNFGGSESFFKRESMTQMKATGGDQYIWTFLEQRIIITPDGKLLVPHNEGIMTVGNNRSYNKHTLHALKWSGSLFRELWRTRQEPSYLADFAYDPATGEVVLLEVVKKGGMFSKGKSVVSIQKLE
jgi:hypothetical protein